MRIHNIILYTNMAVDSVVKTECVTVSYQISGGEGFINGYASKHLVIA